MEFIVRCCITFACESIDDGEIEGIAAKGESIGALSVEQDQKLFLNIAQANLNVREKPTQFKLKTLTCSAGNYLPHSQGIGCNKAEGAIPALGLCDKVRDPSSPMFVPQLNFFGRCLGDELLTQASHRLQRSFFPFLNGIIDYLRCPSSHLLVQERSSCARTVRSAYQVNYISPAFSDQVNVADRRSRFECDTNPTLKYAYLDTKQTISPWPTSLVVQVLTVFCSNPKLAHNMCSTTPRLLLLLLLLLLPLLLLRLLLQPRPRPNDELSQL